MIHLEIFSYIIFRLLIINIFDFIYGSMIPYVVRNKNCISISVI